MVGIGTLVNSAAIVAGGLVGLIAGKAMKQRLQDSLQTVCGVSTLFIGIAGAMQYMLQIKEGSLASGQGMLLTIALALGTFVGELLNIERGFEKLGEWLKVKTHSTEDNQFVNGFLTASLTVSIGAMAIVGSIQDGITGDWSILASKSILDFIIVLVMTCSMGKGCIFSALPVLVLEGLMTALAVLLKPLMTDLALSYISMIGSVLIFCVGLNLIWGKKVRVANMLPALVFAIIAAFLPL